MAILGSSNQVFVSSSVISLSGEPEERPVYKKVVVSGYAAGTRGQSMAQTVQSGYLNGPGIKGRNFFRWAETNYTTVGVPVGSISLFTNLDLDLIAPHLPVVAGKTAVALKANSSIGNYIYWAEQYILENYYALKDTAWTADVRQSDGRITIDFADGSSTWFVPMNFNNTAPLFISGGQYSFRYLYILYHQVDNTTNVADNDQLLIYKVDSGNAGLDDLFSSEFETGKFYPFIPIRIDNEFLSDTYEPLVYANCKRAYKKATNNSFDDLIDKVGSTPELDEIDHAFFVYGVSLNCEDNDSLKYVYRFFKELVSADNQSIVIAGTGTFSSQLKFRIGWETVVEVTGTGLVDPARKKGDLWFVNNLSETNFITLYFQETETTWKKLDITGLKHTNYVYNGKEIIITGSQALSDLEESGFLVPLNNDILNGMDLITSTQIMSQSAYLVLNSYKVVKKKWYQTGLFKILVFVALITITVLLPTVGATATAAYASIGTAIGLSGILAVIAGAVIVNVATMLLMKIFTRISEELFGEKFAAIFSAVMAVAAIVVSSTGAFGSNGVIAWGNLMSASNIMQMTYAIGNGISGYIQSAAAEMAVKTAKVNADYEAEQKIIRNKWLEQFGMSNGEFDPLMLVGGLNGNYLETEAEFLSRTLLTGSDIAEMSMDMITNFSEYTLALPNRK